MAGGPSWVSSQSKKLFDCSLEETRVEFAWLVLPKPDIIIELPEFEKIKVSAVESAKTNELNGSFEADEAVELCKVPNPGEVVDNELNKLDDAVEPCKATNSGEVFVIGVLIQPDNAVERCKATISGEADVLGELIQSDNEVEPSEVTEAGARRLVVMFVEETDELFPAVNWFNKSSDSLDELSLSSFPFECFAPDDFALFLDWLGFVDFFLFSVTLNVASGLSLRIFCLASEQSSLSVLFICWLQNVGLKLKINSESIRLIFKMLKIYFKTEKIIVQN